MAPPLLIWAAAGGIVAVMVALGLRTHGAGNKVMNFQEGGPTDGVYVIGDLHGDVDCGKFWVDQLQLIDWDAMKWRNPQASLVFMGDYCDKGPYSYQTMLFVKSLTDAFPDKVTALMGNHELELLRDRDERTTSKYMHLAWSAVHPGEYRHYLTNRTWDEQDDLVLDLLLNASLEIYSNRWQNSVVVAPETKDGEKVAIPDIFEENMRPLISERLREYQEAYLQAFASNTTLGQWVESLKVAHVERGIFFTHGGLHPKFVAEIQRVGGVDILNDMMRKHASTDKFVDFMATYTGQIVYNMLIYRGNHKELDNCGSLPQQLETLQLKRLAVGHTPNRDVRSMCQEQFWALDSLLGRWIRTSGNMYCPMDKRSSQNGAFVCDAIPAQCEGQVVKMTEDTVEVIYPGRTQS